MIISYHGGLFLIRWAARAHTVLRRPGKGINGVPVPRHKVDTHRIRPRTDKEAQGDDHGDAHAASICHGAHERRHDGTANHTADDEARAALGVASESAHAEGHDGREADGLKEERNKEHGQAYIAVLGDGGREKDDAHGHVKAKHVAGAGKVHEADTNEATNGKGSLCTGE